MPFHRRFMVHLCRETGKEVDWSVVGANLEVDRKVLELVKDPLIHMVRNAIDHGIEAPDVREAAGKPRRGHLVVTVAPSEGGRISIEVADDGRGFALDALRDAAVRSRLASADQLRRSERCGSGRLRLLGGAWKHEPCHHHNLGTRPRARHRARTHRARRGPHFHALDAEPGHRDSAGIPGQHRHLPRAARRRARPALSLATRFGRTRLRCETNRRHRRAGERFAHARRARLPVRQPRPDARPPACRRG